MTKRVTGTLARTGLYLTREEPIYTPVYIYRGAEVLERGIGEGNIEQKVKRRDDNTIIRAQEFGCRVSRPIAIMKMKRSSPSVLPGSPCQCLLIFVALLAPSRANYPSPSCRSHFSKYLLFVLRPASLFTTCTPEHRGGREKARGRNRLSSPTHRSKDPREIFSKRSRLFPRRSSRLFRLV